MITSKAEGTYVISDPDKIMLVNFNIILPLLPYLS
jgi:hypothetical protein